MLYVKKLVNLEVLYLHDTQIANAGLVHVAKLTSLTQLSLDNAQVSQAGLESLRKLPRLESSWSTART